MLELHALERRARHPRERARDQRFPEARRALDEDVTAGDHGDEQPEHELRLANDDLRHLRADAVERLLEGLGRHGLRRCSIGLVRSNDEAKVSLAEEIRSGRCVAFIGAGFSAPVCRSWSELLLAVAAKAPDAAIAEQARALIARKELEIAAQLLEDAFASEDGSKLLEVVRAHTPRHRLEEPAQVQMRRRTELLAGIPFSAVLTTNFDDVLRGKVLDRQTYGLLLRDADRRWLQRRFWHPRDATPVLKLHGELRGDKGITLSRRGYRARLYAEPGYLNALRTVFMTKTVLYLGFSFNDAYLNELRSEALAYLGADRESRSDMRSCPICIRP